MDNRMKWVSAKIRTGWIFLAAGVFVAVLGRFIEHQYSYLPYNLRIILLTGIGVGYLVRYWAALKDEQSAKRLTVEERDERTVLIRARAGNRAYWVSTVLIYTGLMWASFAANGGLPDLSGDVLWYFLAAGVLVPFGAYIVSILVDQQNL
jgi:hypothetical protein